jgi:hypothetical protein
VKIQKKHSKIDFPYCSVGWVDIGTVARVPMNVVVYISKRMENSKKN